MYKLLTAFVSGLLLVLVCVSGEAAVEDENSANPRKMAKAAFEQGKTLFAQRDYEGAAQQFRLANELSPSWKLYFNIAQCEAAAKRYGRAYEVFQLYIVEAGDELSPEREEQVSGELAKLKGKVGSLKIEAPTGASIHIDGVLRATAPTIGNIFVAAGIRHEVVVSHEDSQLLQETVQVWSGETTLIEVPELERASTGDLPTTDEATTEQAVEIVPPTNTLKTTGWILAGTGVATMAAGIVTGALTASKAKTLESDCPGQVCDNPDDQDRIDTAEALGNTTTILLAAGGAVVLTGIVLVAAGARREKLRAAGVEVTPVVTAGTVGILLGGRF